MQINVLIKPQLIAIAKQKANDSLTYLTQRVIQSLDYDSDQLIIYEHDSQGEISSITYNTKYLNEILYESVEAIDENLNEAYAGESVEALNDVFHEDGIIHEVALGYLTPISFLQNFGYHFKIYLELSSYVNGNIRVDSEPYGINSSLITVYLDINITGTILTSIYQEELNYVSSLPLIIQVVNGEVGSFQTYKKSE